MHGWPWALQLGVKAIVLASPHACPPRVPSDSRQLRRLARVPSSLPWHAPAFPAPDPRAAGTLGCCERAADWRELSSPPPPPGPPAALFLLLGFTLPAIHLGPHSWLMRSPGARLSALLASGLPISSISTLYQQPGRSLHEVLLDLHSMSQPDSETWGAGTTMVQTWASQLSLVKGHHGGDQAVHFIGVV